MTTQNAVPNFKPSKSLHIHNAKYIINEFCYIYDPEILNYIEPQDIVKISFTVDYPKSWKHDSPYVKIIVIANDNVLGEIIDFNRKDTTLYPLNIGEHIWFTKRNIIEIPSDLLDDINDERLNIFRKEFLTNDAVKCSGPLFTIDSEYDSLSSECSDSSTSESGNSHSDYDSEYIDSDHDSNYSK